MFYYPGENWYAIRVKSRFEGLVERCLGLKKITSLNLTYQVLSKRKDRKKFLTKAFFPGYMFIRSELDPTIHVEILKSIGVINIIKNSKGPLPIPDDQIENVLKLKQYEGKIITLNEFARGMAVRIIQGPLKGVLGVVDQIQRDLIKISIDSIPGSVAIQVSPQQIEPVHSQNEFTALAR